MSTPAAALPVEGTGQPELTRRNLMIGGALLATAGLVATRVPAPQPGILGREKLDGVIPKAIGPWRFETASGVVVPPPDQMLDALYSDLLTRVYTAPNMAPMMLLIAYSGRQDGMLQVHRPEFCYTAGGFALSDSVVRDVAVTPGFAIPTRFLTATGGDRIEQLMYWTRMGPSFPTRWLDQRMAVLRENLAGRIPDGLLVRISTITPDRAAAASAIDGFTRALVAASPPKARQLLIGRAGA